MASKLAVELGRTPDAEKWRFVWRHGFAPYFSRDGLMGLHKACIDDDPRLIQGSTTNPSPLLCIGNWGCEAACGASYPGVVDNGGFFDPKADKGTQRGYARLRNIENYFAVACFRCGETIGEVACERWFLNWFDDSPRDVVLRELARECERELDKRGITWVVSVAKTAVG